jgi:hypothetical protein
MLGPRQLEAQLQTPQQEHGGNGSEDDQQQVGCHGHKFIAGSLHWDDIA